MDAAAQSTQEEQQVLGISGALSLVSLRDQVDMWGMWFVGLEKMELPALVLGAAGIELKAYDGKCLTLKGGGLRRTNFKRLVKERGITHKEKTIRKEAGEQGKCSIKLKAGKVSRRKCWKGIRLMLLRVQISMGSK